MQRKRFYHYYCYNPLNKSPPSVVVLRDSVPGEHGRLVFISPAAVPAFPALALAVAALVADKALAHPFCLLADAVPRALDVLSSAGLDLYDCYRPRSDAILSAIDIFCSARGGGGRA